MTTYADIPREVLETLVCLLDADAFVAVDNWELRVRIGEVEIVVGDAPLQELVRREWLELTDTPDGVGGSNLHVSVTSAGRYHGERWYHLDERNRKRERRAVQR